MNMHIYITEDEDLKEIDLVVDALKEEEILIPKTSRGT